MSWPALIAALLVALILVGLAIFGVQVARLIQEELPPKPEVLEPIMVFWKRLEHGRYLIGLSDATQWRGNGSWWYEVPSGLNAPTHIHRRLCQIQQGIEAGKEDAL